MAKFELAEAITGASEGGYANDPTDRGGETYCGIARKFWRNWPGWIYIDICKAVGTAGGKYPPFPKNIDHDGIRPTVHDFYIKNFWQKIRGDSISDQDVANILYDIAVNMGVGRAGQFLQLNLNLLNRNQKDYPDLKVDGGIGIKTLFALDSYLAKRGQKGKYIFLFNLMVQQGGLWINLASKSPDQERFMNGWGSRAISNIKHITDNYYGIKS